jgi:hypothetical protein
VWLRLGVSIFIPLELPAANPGTDTKTTTARHGSRTAPLCHKGCKRTSHSSCLSYLARDGRSWLMQLPVGNCLNQATTDLRSVCQRSQESHREDESA